MRADLADIVTGATGIPLERLEPDVPLAQLGIGSLQALQIVGDVQEQYNVALDPTLWFDGLTLQQMVDEMARLIAASGAAGGPKGSAPVLTPDMPPTPAAQPASFNQSQMYLLDSRGAGASLNIPFALDLHGQLQQSALLHAIDALLARHDALRARFVLDSGAPEVVYAPAAGFTVPLERIRLAAGSGSEVDLEAAVAAAVVGEAVRPFSLLQGPLVRIALLEVLPTRHVLVVTTHHSISDGWSGEQTEAKVAGDVLRSQGHGPS